MKLKGLNAEQTELLVPDHTFLFGWRGSVAHKTYTPTYGKCEHDDKDVMGACFGPVENYIGFKRFEQKEAMVLGEDGIIWDSVVYEIRKFVRLLLKGNPNVMAMLFLPENLYIHLDEVGEDLLPHKDWFVGKHMYKPFKGYASSQLSKMDRNATSNLGAVRKKLVEKFGYDCKHAGHLIRLLRMGIEFLTSGELNIERHDASELIDIKNGVWTRKAVLDESRRLFALLDEAYVKSDLPAVPQTAKVEEMMSDHIMTYLNSNPYLNPNGN